MSQELKLQVLDFQIMTRKKNVNNSSKKKENELNNICEECKKFDESVNQNLILYGYKLCNVCRNSKIIFPI